MQRMSPTSEGRIDKKKINEKRHQTGVRKTINKTQVPGFHSQPLPFFPSFPFPSPKSSTSLVSLMMMMVCRPRR